MRICTLSPTSSTPSFGNAAKGSGTWNAKCARFVPTLRTTRVAVDEHFAGVDSNATRSGKSSAGLSPTHRIGTTNRSRSVATTRSSA